MVSYNIVPSVNLSLRNWALLAIIYFLFDTIINQLIKLFSCWKFMTMNF